MGAHFQNYLGYFLFFIKMILVINLVTYKVVKYKHYYNNI